MTPVSEQLRRVHALLRAANVPCTLRTDPGTSGDGATVLLAGTPNAGPWEVQLVHTDGKLVLLNERAAIQIPRTATDSAIADAVKLRVVQAWAEQGDPQAAAVLRALTGAAGQGSRASTGPGYRGRRSDSDDLRSITVEYVNPMQLVGELFAAATRIGWDMVKGCVPGYVVAMAMFHPWLRHQRASIRR